MMKMNPYFGVCAVLHDQRKTRQKNDRAQGTHPVDQQSDKSSEPQEAHMGIMRHAAPRGDEILHLDMTGVQHGFA